MKRNENLMISIFLLMTVLPPLEIYGQSSGEGQTQTVIDDETAVKAVVDSFLVALGRGEMEKVEAMFLPNANIGSIRISNGETNIFTISAEDYIAGRKEKGGKTFQEPVHEYTVNISQGLLAFVRANATLYYDGEASHHTDDYFILMKDNGTWKFLSGSYTTHPLTTGR